MTQIIGVSNARINEKKGNANEKEKENDEEKEEITYSG